LPILNLDGKRGAESLIASKYANNLALYIVMTLLVNKEKSLRIKDLSEKLNIREDLLLEVIEKLEESAGIKKAYNDTAILTPAGEDRLKMAVTAVTLGATIEETASTLSWKEFESFCTKVLEENGYSCMQEFRFKSIRGKRFECDILATRKPLLVMADCKHYSGRVNGLRTVVDKQKERVDALSKSVTTLVRSIPKIIEWNEAAVVPVIITLFPENIAMINNVPVVPGFKLNQFIQELPSNVDGLARSMIYPSRQEKLVKKRPRER
jgi:Holliday junction resolvase-like predicted endonuclease/predicted transcriptional regulator